MYNIVAMKAKLQLNRIGYTRSESAVYMKCKGVGNSNVTVARSVIYSAHTSSCNLRVTRTSGYHYT